MRVKPNLHIPFEFASQGFDLALFMIIVIIHKDQHGAKLFINLEKKVLGVFLVSRTVKSK